ncbi:MAG: type II toxin-antitoxin system RelE/ParE family toxin [Phycisphaerae bacterium]|nr:type II toxin-antitoxin system RelE/ParE family toxin [Phycisphaerae bacterium]
MKPIVIHPAAEAEFHDAITYLEARQEGLGREFSRTVYDALMEAAEHPRRYRVIMRRVRRMLIPRFHYALIYLDEPEHFYLLAVAHSARRSGYWKDRL